MVRAWCVRWLQAAGLTREEVQQRVVLALARVSRYPFPMPILYRVCVFFLEYFGPLLVLAKLKRATTLNAFDYEKFEQKFHHYRVTLIRAMFIFARAPLWEQLSPEKKPDSRGPHPLSGKLSVPAKGDKFDVIIIGSGAGGAPIARELSRSGRKVALVESGGLVEPQTTAYAIEHYYLAQSMTFSMKGGLLPVFAGDTIGGTTSINSGTCLRPDQECLGWWDKKLGTTFADGLLDPYFEEIEKVMGIGVPPRELLGPSAFKFEEGLKQLGREGSYVLPRNAPGCEGSGRCCFICPTGSKLGTDLAFLPEAIENGCVLFGETRAVRIREHKDGVWVRVSHRGKKSTLEAKQLVIAAGAFGTTRLIRKNRLGTHWRDAGRHLRIHPASKVFAYYKEPVHGERGVPQALGYRAPELKRVVFEGIFTPRSTAGPVVSAAGAVQKWWLERYDHLASFGLMVRERGEGRLFYLRDWPIIRYRMHKKDVRDMMAGLILCGEAFLASGAERILMPLVGRKNEYDDIDELRALDPSDFKQSQLINSGFHPQGTAAMGVVVNKNMGLKGTNHIYVCDASVMPATPGVNPMVTIMGLSLYLAHMMQSH